MCYSLKNRNKTFNINFADVNTFINVLTSRPKMDKH